MPFVFVGAFYGVMFGHMMHELWRVCIFGVTVAWSVQTTAKKACKLIAKEKEDAAKKEALLAAGGSAMQPMAVAINSASTTDKLENYEPGMELNNQALSNIYYEEKYHFTGRRVCFVLVNFCLLLLNSAAYKNLTDRNQKVLVQTIFVVGMILLTWYQVKRVKQIHIDKEKYGYKFAPNDLKFETVGKIIKLAFFCMIAACLCGMTGIAGGMVLGPLFLAYNMVP